MYSTSEYLEKISSSIILTLLNSKFGASLFYANRKGTGGATGPQILADTTLPSDAEVIVMLGEDCSDGGCGYTRPGSIAHRR